MSVLNVIVAAATAFGLILIGGGLYEFSGHRSLLAYQA